MQRVSRCCTKYAKHLSALEVVDQREQGFGRQHLDLAGPRRLAALSGRADQATIVRALSLANTSGMNFGTVLANELGGTVSLSPSGDYTALGVTVANSSDVVPGKFRIFGTHSQAYSITFPQAAIFSGSGDIRVVTFMHDAGGTPTLDNDGKGLFNMGATLRLGAHPPAGTYYGNVDVIISNH